MRAFWFFIALFSLSTVALADDGRSFVIGGEPFSEAEILDARALPSLDGAPSIMITFSEAGAKRLAEVTRRQLGQAMPVVLNGKTLMAPVVFEPLRGNVIEVVGGFKSIDDAARHAKLIAGKDPLPDSLEDE